MANSEREDSNKQEERLIMNIWDSVHRGLEKASQEAARISKMQKARSQMERLGHQISAQEQTLLTKTVALYESGQLQQSELIPFCQELVSLRQQFTQTQNELQTIQSQVSQQSGTTQNNPTDAGMPALPSPSYPSSVEHTMPASVPPPPPDSDPAATYAQYYAQDTMPAASVPPPPPGFYASQPTITPINPSLANLSERRCPQCGTNAQPSDLFCQNCGTSLHADASYAQPTARAESPTTYAYAQNSPDQPNDPSINDQATVRAETNTSPDSLTDQATIRANTTHTPEENQTP